MFNNDTNIRANRNLTELFYQAIGVVGKFIAWITASK